MEIDFEELDYRQTPLGELTLRRRANLQLGRTAFEVKLDEEFLMSSLFTEGETALARIALERCRNHRIDMAIGGLGLGHTASAALEDERVVSLVVIEALDGVIDWHRQGLVPLGAALTGDSRCRFVHGDFFKMAGAGAAGFDPLAPGRQFDVVVVDIDHSPRHLLDADHGAFYRVDGFRGLCAHLLPDGIFAMWSNDPPDEEFFESLREVFTAAETRVVTFDNPYTGATSSCTIYVGQRE